MKVKVLVLSSCFALGIFVAGFFYFSQVKKTDRKPSLFFISPEEIVGSPTIQSVFSENKEFLSTFSGELTTIIATGDVIPARSVNAQSSRRNNFIWAFEKTSGFLKNADITFINLETPLIKNCPITVEGMIFCGNSKNVKGLVASGIDVASLANNHAGNHGEEGVEETAELLRSNNIEVAGVSEPIYKTVNGITFAFLGYNDITAPQPGVANVEKEIIKKQIQEARKKAAVVIVTYHWGVEYRDLPDERQIELGHFTIDNGADLVIGNHPHWIQPIEFYKGKLITYAHGNFVFDQMWSEETMLGVVGKYTFYKDKLIDVEYFPVRIVDYGQPYFLEGEEKKKVLERMKINSNKLEDLLRKKNQ